MKIIYLSISTLPSRQANTVHVVNMASCLGELDHETELWVFQNPEEGNKHLSPDEVATYFGVNGNFKIRYLKQPKSYLLRQLHAFWLGLRVARKKPDLVIGRHTLGCFAASLFGANVVYETHQPIWSFSGVGQTLLHHAFRKKLFNGVIVISDALKKILIKETSAPSDYILSVHDGASMPITPSPENLGRKDHLQAGYVGHLYQGRGIDVIIELAKQLPQVDFHLIGGNPEDVDFWKQQVKQLDNVLFHGYLPPAKAANLRASCDILLAPYQEDTSVPGGNVTTDWMSPLKIFEYMTTGKAIISSDFPVLREVLKDQSNALLVPAANVKSWKEAIEKLETDSAFREKIGQKALLDFQEKYSWLKRTEKIIEFAKRNRD